MSRQRRHGLNINGVTAAIPLWIAAVNYQFKIVTLLSPIRYLVKRAPVTALPMQRSPGYWPVLSFSVSECVHSLGKTSPLEHLILPSTTRKSGTHLLQQNDRAEAQIIWDWYRIARSLLLACSTLPVLPQIKRSLSSTMNLQDI